jgi:hypothetical protein
MGDNRHNSQDSRSGFVPKTTLLANRFLFAFRSSKDKSFQAIFAGAECLELFMIEWLKKEITKYFANTGKSVSYCPCHYLDY